MKGSKYFLKFTVANLHSKTLILTLFDVTQNKKNYTSYKVLLKKYKFTHRSNADIHQ